MRRLLVGLLITAASLAAWFTLRAGDTATVLEPDMQNVAYGEHQRQRYDVYRPNGDGPFPAIVWIHGGGWVGGDKAYLPPASLLVDQGYVVVAINYRFALDGATIADSVTDTNAAIEHFLDAADSFDVDADRVGLYGHSAGGHLAAMAATKLDVAAVVTTGAPTDFASLVDPQRSVFEARASQDAAAHIQTLLGCAGAGCDEAVASLSPARIAPGPAPVLVVHGSDDSIVSVEQATRYIEHLRASGVAVESDVIDGGDHWSKNQTAIDGFFARYLG